MTSSTDGRSFASHDTAGYVGFANLPNQVHRKSVKKGFEFTLMVVGESGLGKSTLINSLFLTDLYPGTYLKQHLRALILYLYVMLDPKWIFNIFWPCTDRQLPSAAENAKKKTIQIDASTVEIEERGVKLRLTVVDTPGFGDAMDNTDSFQQIIRYIDEQFERLDFWATLYCFQNCNYDLD